MLAPVVNAKVFSKHVAQCVHSKDDRYLSIELFSFGLTFPLIFFFSTMDICRSLNINSLQIQSLMILVHQGLTFVEVRAWTGPCRRPRLPSPPVSPCKCLCVLLLTNLPGLLAVIAWVDSRNVIVDKEYFTAERREWKEARQRSGNETFKGPDLSSAPRFDRLWQKKYK